MMVSKMKIDKKQCKYLKNSPTPVHGEIVRGKYSGRNPSYVTLPAPATVTPTPSSSRVKGHNIQQATVFTSGNTYSGSATVTPNFSTITTG